MPSSGPSGRGAARHRSNGFGSMLAHTRAILWAQARTLRNFYPRGNLGRLALTTVLSAAWYGAWLAGAIFAAIALARTEDPERLYLMLGWGAMAAFLYWQVVPVLMVSSGASLDLKRLLVYPIPTRQLFGLEVILRLSTGVEMTLVVICAAVGLVVNPLAPVWAPVGLAVFAAFNLFLAAGIRQLLARVFARPYVREAAVLLLIMAVAAPRVLLARGVPEPVEQIVRWFLNPAFPFDAVARVVLGERLPVSCIVLIAWTVLAYGFGRWQFERNLRLEGAEAESSRTGGSLRWLEGLYRLPSLFLRDPIAAVVEKELRFLSRAPRFRLVFVMGFSFGMLVWLPLSVQRSTGTGGDTNYLTFISAYSLLLLSEVTFWNTFGFDRGAAQLYFFAPTPIRSVVRGKNIAAVLVVILEVTLIATVWMILGMPLSPGKLFEAYAVTLVLAMLLLAAGNLGSVRYPRPIEPRQSWRSSSAGRFQAMLLLIYPLIAAPVGLAYLARYAFDSHAAFYGVLAFDAVFGAVLYWIALDSAVATLNERRESMLATLSARQGPVAT